MNRTAVTPETLAQEWVHDAVDRCVDSGHTHSPWACIKEAVVAYGDACREDASVLAGMILEYHDRSHGQSVDLCAATLCRDYVAYREEAL